MVYLMVLPVPCFPLSEDTFAMEGAFCEHVRQLQQTTIGRFTQLRLVAPTMSREVYARGQGRWGILSTKIDGVSLCPLHPCSVRPMSYWLRYFIPNLIKLNQEIRCADLVHAGPSNHYRPFEFPALLIASIVRKATIFVVDIDTRCSAEMNYKTGSWSLKSYLLAQTIYNPLKSLQIWLAVRLCSLVLLKGQKLCDDFGVGRTNVRNFIDSAFSNSHIILPSALEEKITSLAIRERPLEIVYFGRLVSYKGIDQSIRAFAKVIANYGLKLRFHIIGAGPEEGCLRELTTSLGLVEYVVFHAPISFGPELFAYLQNNCDLLLATPQSEDTPRSALDAMASGIPILAFDTYYYRDLQPSGAVEVVPWNSLEKLAQKILEYAEDKTLLENASRHAVRFAQENTQEIWLRRRYNWTLEALEKLR